MKTVKALVMTGYGLNCDYETDFSLKIAGAESHRVHINELTGDNKKVPPIKLRDFHILVFGGGFSWADDHGAGVLLASKLKRRMGEEIENFINQGNLVIGICNGFQTLVNLGLLPGFDGQYEERSVALTHNDSGNFVDTWVNLKGNPSSPCVFTKGIREIELPVRHGEGKFFASEPVIRKLAEKNQIVFQYADKKGIAAQGQQPFNPNGSLMDIAGICDASGRVLGLMPHPEAFNHFTNHPDWNWKKQDLLRKGTTNIPEEGDGIKIFRNAVEYFHG
jgi:phosphoribosylformylglycinamidine synthase I